MEISVLSEKENYSQIRKQLEERELNVRDELKHLSHEEHLLMHDESRLPYAVACINLTGDLNVGSIIRSAAMLGCETVYIYGRKKFDKRGVVGAHNYQRVEYISIDLPDEVGDFPPDINYEILLQVLEGQGYTPFGLETGGARIDQMAFTQIQSPCIIVGNENMGLPNYLRNKIPLVSIPQTGVMRSLNVGVAAAIAMSEIQRQFVPPQSILGDTDA
jgi:tRNA (guanosine-2'-O-)-methyltransferase